MAQVIEIEIIVHVPKAHLLLGVVIEMTDARETISRHLLAVPFM